MAEKSGNRCCGNNMYTYMSPSYIPLDDDEEVASYRTVLDAVVENSSAHGLPTLYRANGNSTMRGWSFLHASDCFA